MEVYIRGAAVISPQRTFGQEGFPGEIMLYSDVRSLRCIEPNYREFIDPMVSRRMSRIVKMGVCGALRCMQSTGISMPDAIIAGTGLGCLEDTEKFLTSVYANNEKLLNPTPFIQSTHNTVAGAIALAIKCHGYNTTYTHRGFSFESAIRDTMLQLENNPDLNILAGGFDELTETSFNITRRLGLWKNHVIDTNRLEDYKTRGSLPGEGAAFFMISGKPHKNDMARLTQMETFYTPDSSGISAVRVKEFLRHSNINKPDVVVLGINGDYKTDTLYHQVTGELFSNIPCVRFKHFCGEYDTASSFACWLASVIIKEQQIPTGLSVGYKQPGTINNVLIYNHLRGINHSLYLFEKC
jgi:hypothetical protein